MTRGRLTRVLAAAGLVGSATGATLAAISACSDPYSAGAEPPVADASDAGEGAVDAGPPPDPCVHVLPPAPPATDDAPTVELPAFFVAIRSLSVSTEGKGAPGYDLDRVCTCDPRPDTAHAGTDSCLRRGGAASTSTAESTTPSRS